MLYFHNLLLENNDLLYFYNLLLELLLENNDLQ